MVVGVALLALGISVSCATKLGDTGADGLDANASDGAPASDASIVDAMPVVCGDGSLGAGEDCDDFNLMNGDGCSSVCELEDGFACPTPGEDCVRIVTCGNGRIEGTETCDDGNTTAADGCSDTCFRESGWDCPLAGTLCVAALCGDGIVAGFEACDDAAHGAGCVDCELEPGYHCPLEGQPCVATTCGDGMAQGLEECDDGNAIVGDGCTPTCLREPDCTGGICTAVCGDSTLQIGEECDDGNIQSGDGCSSSCLEEQGFDCVEVALPDPASVTISATIRDFINHCGSSSRLKEGDVGATVPYGHPDFQCYNGAASGMVATDLSVDKKPVRVANSKTLSDDSFNQWYRSDTDVNKTFAIELTLPSIGGGAYQFDSVSFYPATGLGFDVEDCGGSPCEALFSDGNGAGNVNFFFTSEVHFWFEYNGTELLEFSGDDDVWVFINDKLAVDIGGVHGRADGSVDLSNGTVATNLGLTVGGVYQAIVFQAERHTSKSQYRLTLTNFNQTPSTCTDSCGDGVISSREVCDDGINNGMGDGSAYGGCDDDCTLEPFCGDGNVDMGFGEICDDGLNLGGNASACAPGCTSLGSSCGDGVVQTDDGEQCDDGNTVGGDGCTAGCLIEID